MAVLKSICEAVKNELNRAFSPTFTALCQTTPRYRVDELATLKVSVMDRLLQTAGLSRHDRKKIATVAINFMQHLNPPVDGSETRQDLIDELTTLVESVANHFTPGGTFSEYPYAKLVDVQFAGQEPRLVKDLEEADVFNSSIALTFHVVEP